MGVGGPVNTIMDFEFHKMWGISLLAEEVFVS
jgi:hypothetical protein